MNRKLDLQPPVSPRTSPRLHLIALAVLATAAASPALAQSDSYNYFGISGGHARGHLDEQRVTDTVIAPGVFTNYSLSRDPKDVGYRMFLGRQFNRYFGMELGYYNLGKQRFDNTTTPNGRLSAQVRNQGANLDVVGTFPLTERFSLLGRAGVTYARTRGNFAGSGAVVVTNPNPSERGANPKVGLGLQYAFSEGFIMRGEAERYRINDSVGGTGRVNLYSVSLVFPFGRAPAAAPRSAYVAPMPAPAPAPVVIAQAPPPPVEVTPAPAPAPAPVVMAPRRVSYAAESVFGFDRSTLRPEGMAALDSFVSELSGTDYSNIVVEGHTDRLGTDHYNQTLSQQRAEAVKEYLVRSGRLDPAKISAVGKGESMPVTNAEDCKGRAANAALVACLQPDRRVEIEVSGTR